MKEEYLHFIWKTKRIPHQALVTTEGKEIQIHKFGTHNTHASGPDFLDASITLNNIEWHGNIEIHVKASDWYKHQHHYDAAYNNVILHVVLEADETVNQAGEYIPTIELKNVVDENQLKNFKSLLQNLQDVNCHAMLTDVNDTFVHQMIAFCLEEKWKHKLRELPSHLQNCEREMCYYLMACCFGMKVNKLPFENIATLLPLAKLQTIPVHEYSDVIWAVSGLQHDVKNKIYAFSKVIRNYHLSAVPSVSWKRKGVRPPSFPVKKIEQFISLCQNFDFKLENYLRLSAKEFTIEIKRKLHKAMEGKSSRSFVDLLIINGIVPTLYYRALKKNDKHLKELTIQLLHQLPAEKNSIMRKWKSAGAKIDSAFDSQGLLQLYHSYCKRNKCLQCKIGSQILEEEMTSYLKISQKNPNFPPNLIA